MRMLYIIYYYYLFSFLKGTTVKASLVVVSPFPQSTTTIFCIYEKKNVE